MPTVRATVAPLLYSGFVTLVSNDTFTEDFMPWRQFIPFDLIITNQFDPATLTRDLAYSDEPATRIFRFVDRLNKDVEVSEVLKYQINSTNGSTPLCCVFDRAYQVIRILSPICPQILIPTVQPVVVATP